MKSRRLNAILPIQRAAYQYSNRPYARKFGPGGPTFSAPDRIPHRAYGTNRQALSIVSLSDPGADSFADLGRWHLFPERSGKPIAFVVALRAEPCWSPGARPNEVSVNQGIDFTVQSYVVQCVRVGTSPGTPVPEPFAQKDRSL